MAATANSFVWYELMTSDLAAAETFYKGVVGWATQDAGMPEPYTMVLAGSSAIGGLMTLPEEARKMGAPPCWVGYIGVPDVDAAAARVQAAGGALHRAPDDIPGVGRFAVVADPQGAGFMLFKGNMDDAPPAPHPEQPAPWVGTSCMPATAPAPGTFTPASLAGPRTASWTWAPWASISCSARAAKRSAA